MCENSLREVLPCRDSRASPGSSGPPPWPCLYFAALFSSMSKVPGKHWAGCGCCEGSGVVNHPGVAATQVGGRVEKGRSPQR